MCVDWNVKCQKHSMQRWDYIYFFKHFYLAIWQWMNYEYSKYIQKFKCYSTVFDRFWWELLSIDVFYVSKYPEWAAKFFTGDNQHCKSLKFTKTVLIFLLLKCVIYLNIVKPVIKLSIVFEMEERVIKKQKLDSEFLKPRQRKNLRTVKAKVENIKESNLLAQQKESERLASVINRQLLSELPGPSVAPSSVSSTDIGKWWSSIWHTVYRGSYTHTNSDGAQLFSHSFVTLWTNLQSLS